jgi:hypothetical protein
MTTRKNSNALDRKKSIALFTAKHIIGNSDIVHSLAAENRLHFLDEVVRQFLWERIIEELANEYMVSKKVPRQRRIAKVVKDEIELLFEGKYDNEFTIKW